MWKKYIIPGIAITILLAAFSWKQAQLSDEVIEIQYQGNTTGNIQNGGYIVEQNGHYYYMNPMDYDHLYEMDSKGENTKPLSRWKYCYELNLCENEIFYIDGMPGAIWKLSLRNGWKQKLVHERAGNLIVTDRYIFYRRSEDSDWGKLYRTNLSGHRKKLLAHDVSVFGVENEYVYYVNTQDDGALWRMTLDGQNPQRIIEDTINCFVYDNEHIYYNSGKNGFSLCRYNKELGTVEMLDNSQCFNLNQDEDWLYYRNQSDQGNLYRIRKDGSEKQLLATGNIVDINIINDKVYYRKVTEDAGYYILDVKNKIENKWPNQ